MKDITFLGNTLDAIRDLTVDARRDVGYQLDKVQNGEQPDDFKPMPNVGKGVNEIRVWEEDGTYRVIYTARLKESVYVLHVFKKDSQEARQADIDLVKKRLKSIPKE